MLLFENVPLLFKIPPCPPSLKGEITAQPTPNTYNAGAAEGSYKFAILNEQKRQPQSADNQ
jgi:hypothetical protein